MQPLISRMPGYLLQRWTGRAWLLPVSYTVSPLYACNSRCKTCFVYENKVRTLTVDEYRRITESISQRAFWLTVSGGEPFLRPDLQQVAEVLVEGLDPSVINFPTNGTFPEKVVEISSQLAAQSPQKKFIVNLSLDDVEHRHDEIRGFDGNWDLAMTTLAGLKAAQKEYPNLVVGIHTVISRFNVARFPEICDRLLALEPDSFITEIAEQRVELRTEGLDISPKPQEYAAAVAHLQARLRGRKPQAIAMLIAQMRAQYYRDVVRLLETGEQIHSCYAGTTSCHILPDGKVVACGVVGDSLGDLRAVDYDFSSVWRSKDAAKSRRRIKEERCRCPLANQAYMNMVMSAPTMAKVGSRWGAASLGFGSEA